MAEFMSDEAIRIMVEVANGEDPPVTEDEERREFREAVKQQIEFLRENGFNIGVPGE